MALRIDDGEGSSLEWIATINDAPLTQQLKSIQETIRKAGEQSNKHFENTAKGVAAGTAAVKAMEKAFDFLGDSVKAALDQQAIVDRFKNTLEGVGRMDSFDRISRSVDEMAKKFTYLDDGDLIKVFNSIIDYGKLSEGQIRELLPVIVDFAAKQGTSIEKSAATIIKALEGQGTELKKYGINLKGTKTEGERLGIIMTTLKAKVDGAGEAFAKSAEGGIRKAREEFNNLKEDIGSKLIPVLSTLMGWVNGALGGLKIIAAEIKNAFLEVFDKQQFLQNQLDKKRDIQQKAASANAEKAFKDPVFEAELKRDLDTQQKLVAYRLGAIKRARKDGEEEVEKAKQDFKDAQDNVRVLALSLQELDALKSKALLGGGGFEIEKPEKEKHEKVNGLIQDRLDLLQDIADLERDAIQSGLLKELSDLDKINEKYDLKIAKAKEFNEAVDKASAKDKVPKQSLVDIENFRKIEVSNTQLKQEAAAYKEHLDVQRTMFEQYEETKKRIGVDKANELYREQRKGFESYLDYLDAEAKKLAPKVALQIMFPTQKIANIGEILRAREITAEQNALNDKQKQAEIANLTELLTITKSFADQKRDINNKYKDDILSLEGQIAAGTLKISEEDYAARLQKLKEFKDEALKELDNVIVSNSDLFKKLAQDTTMLTLDELKKFSKELGDILKSGKFVVGDKILDIPPELIVKTKAVKESIDQTVVSFDKLVASGEALGTIGNSLQDLAGVFAEMNSGLGQAIGLMGSFAVAASKAISSYNAFIKAQEATKIANKDNDAAGKVKGIAGQVAGALGIVGAVVGVISAITGIFKAAAEKRRQAEREALEAQDRIYRGEQEINLLYRQRAREQVAINKLRLQGIQDELKLLEEQKDASVKQFESVLKELGKLRYVATEADGLTPAEISRANIQGGLLLAGKSYSELEKLFFEGRLSDRAKEFFETLQKINNEIGDIERLYAEAIEKEKVAYTATTSDAILDSIVTGFKGGLRTMQDFASTFEDLMKNAVLNALKYKVLEEPLKAFYEQFAVAATSDDILTEGEIAELKKRFETIIEGAGKKFDQLKDITKLDFNIGADGGRGLSGAIRGITAQQADLLAGTLGGVHQTARESLDLAFAALKVHQQIEINTAQTVQRLDNLTSKMHNWFIIEGIKIR